MLIVGFQFAQLHRTSARCLKTIMKQGFSQNIIYHCRPVKIKTIV